MAPLIYVYETLSGSRYTVRGKGQGVRGGPFDSLAEAIACRDAAVPAQTLEQLESRTARRRERADAGPWRTEHQHEVARRVSLDVLTHDCERPRYRAECADGPRPCPWYGCRHHLGADESGIDGLRYADPERLDELPHTCALDVAEQGGHTLEEVGSYLGVSKERVRQIEARAVTKSRAAMRAHEAHLADVLATREGTDA